LVSNDRNRKPQSSDGLRRVRGACTCGDVVIEIVFPAFWAWHDHSAASRKAHGAAYATYIGCWKKNVRVAKGKNGVATYDDVEANTVRSFCARCGTPLFFERSRSAHMINIPRALFSARIGREPRYHLHIEETPDWRYNGEPLAPLKGYPGVFWENPRSRRKTPRKQKSS
jgi:hypothetical protein